MKKSLIALAFGTLALGMTEFVMMGILADVAQGLHVSIPQAGHLISAYALGVTCGAPMLTVAYRYKLKSILIFLGSLMLLGALLCTFAPDFHTLLAARFIAGLPHGAYFGVASIAAVRLADEDHKTGAVSIMIAGMTIANLLGIPFGTALSHSLTWRVPFALVVLLSILVVFYIWKWVPDIGRIESNGYKGQFRFLKHLAPWLIVGATCVGNCGIFCMYSYVNPLMIKEGGFTPEMLSLIMLAAGFGMVVGNMTSGKLSDHYKPGMVACITQGAASLALLAIFFAAHCGWLSAALVVACTTCLFAVSSPQQFLIIKYAPGGEMLGGAAIQMAFNIGNAVGAFCGGLPMEHGLGYNYPALVGVPFAVAGCGLLLWFSKRYESSPEKA